MWFKAVRAAETSATAAISEAISAAGSGILCQPGGHRFGVRGSSSKVDQAEEGPRERERRKKKRNDEGVRVGYVEVESWKGQKYVREGVALITQARSLTR